VVGESANSAFPVSAGRWPQQLVASMRGENQRHALGSKRFPRGRFAVGTEVIYLRGTGGQRRNGEAPTLAWPIRQPSASYASIKKKKRASVYTPLRNTVPTELRSIWVGCSLPLAEPSEKYPE